MLIKQHSIDRTEPHPHQMFVLLLRRHLQLVQADRPVSLAERVLGDAPVDQGTCQHTAYGRAVKRQNFMGNVYPLHPSFEASLGQTKSPQQ